jgi:hypothetical protein
MKIIENILDKMENTLEEIERYGNEAHLLRNEHRFLADKFAKIGETHITIYSMLHESVVMIIEEEKKKGVEVPKGMMEMFNLIHKRMIERFNKAKYTIDEYKKLGY